MLPAFENQTLNCNNHGPSQTVETQLYDNVGQYSPDLRLLGVHPKNYLPGDHSLVHLLSFGIDLPVDSPLWKSALQQNTRACINSNNNKKKKTICIAP